MTRISRGNLHVATPKEELAGTFQHGNNALYYQNFGPIPDSLFEVRRDPLNRNRWGHPRFLQRSTPAVPSPDCQTVVFFAFPGWLCPDCPGGVFLADTDLRNRRPVPVDKLLQVPILGQPTWSLDGRHLYATVRERDGTFSIWQMPVNGDPERRMVWLKDPQHQLFRTSISMSATDFYVTIGERESDVWTMELKKQ